MFNLSFYKDKNVLVTGHTGFKGAWLCKMLMYAGAKVTGYSLKPPTSPSLFEILNLKDQMNSIIGDIRDYNNLNKLFKEVNPEIIFHLAAQTLVRDSYENPVYTYETNVLGTVNILECIRLNGGVKSFVNVTTDKVYMNKEWDWGYREIDELGGFDPYSNSKSCSELITQSYKNSFFSSTKFSEFAISTVRAGNVIGGGDFAKNRIIPDCVKAAIEKSDIVVRNPHSIRPYQHVLDPIFAYLMIAAKQFEDNSLQSCYNIGPNDEDNLSTGQLVNLFVKKWGEGIKWVNKNDGGPHEANYLKLDCSKIRSVFDWTPRWSLEKAVEKVVEWNKCWLTGCDVNHCMDKQIIEFLSYEGGIK
jgi:CDP-glucose 4,6-dehydratase